MSGEYIAAGITLIIGLIILPPITKRLFNKRSDQKTNEVIFQEKDTSISPTIKRSDYHPSAIQRQGVQILESINILSTTINIDTLKGRFNFLEEIYPTHISVSNNPRFIDDMQKSIDKYKLTFYGRIPSEQEVSLLIKPNIENLRSYYTDCIYNCFVQYLNEQVKQIESLKKQDAKNRRIEKIRVIEAEAQRELKDKGFDKERAEAYQIEVNDLLISYLQKKSIESKKSPDQINLDYINAENEKRINSDIVLGVEVHRSGNNHDDCEICEAGAGKYPKDYNWTPWHPGCKCWTTDILPSMEKFGEYLETGYDKSDQFDLGEKITEFPKKMKDYMDRTGFKHSGHEDYFADKK